MTEKNRSPPLSDGTSTEAIEPTILFQKGQVHLYTEISKILEVNRSTIQRRRHAGLEFIKKFMEEEA